jgi:chromosome partitioning protein
MNTLAFLSQKGGSGKTTLAVHTAVTAMEAGERVLLADTDTQGSALMWGMARAAHSIVRNIPPQIVKATAGDISALSKSDGFSLLVVDSAPHTAPEAARIAQSADMAIIPCRPTAFDITAIEPTVNLVRAAALRAVFVLSACPHRAPEIEETRDFLTRYGYPIFPGQITERRSFARAVASGRAVTEFETHGKAADEIRSLWTWLDKELLNGKKR